MIPMPEPSTVGKGSSAAGGGLSMDTSYGENYRPPRDGKSRIFTVYGYERDSERPDLLVEPSVTHRYVGVVEPVAVEQVRDDLARDRPELAWVIEWRLLHF